MLSDRISDLSYLKTNKLIEASVSASNRLVLYSLSGGYDIIPTYNVIL